MEDIFLGLVDDPQLLLVAVAAVFEEIEDPPQQGIKITPYRVNEAWIGICRKIGDQFLKLLEMFVDEITAAAAQLLVVGG